MDDKNHYISSTATTPRRRNNISALRNPRWNEMNNNNMESQNGFFTSKRIHHEDTDDNKDQDMVNSDYPLHHHPNQQKRSIIAYTKQGSSSDRHNIYNISPSTYSAMGTGGLFPSFMKSFPSLFKKTFYFVFGAASILYILNQKHLLPRPLSAVVSKVLFWPTFPITYYRRYGKWISKIDDTLLMGGAPINLLNYPEILRKEYGVKGIINMCEEYRGPIHEYQKLHMEELYLPTTDHFEPSVEDLIKAVTFIRKIQKRGSSTSKSQGKNHKVYVHCRAGHGRSAAVVYAWLLANIQDIQNVDMEELNSYLLTLRDVRKTLWKQANINEFKEWLVLKRQSKMD